jgi:two-component system sensor histidine kinase YesM
MLEKLNSSFSQSYMYLCGGSGKIIYHPRNMQIGAGLYEENSETAAGYEDGIHTENFDGSRIVIVDTISYTGWKAVAVTPVSLLKVGMRSNRYIILLMMLLTMLAVLLLNRLISSRISSPIRRLTASIRDREVTAENVPKVYIGGSSEVRYLGMTLQRLLDRISDLMREIVIEQDEKRKSELDALQSQINPHFLYNTLDSIVWMVEGERNKDAVFMLTQLASLFRISLSKGRTVISMEDELRHALNYSNIQKVRFKDSFKITFDTDPEVNGCCTVKLIIQPIIENAIYYGVKDMEDEGEITVRSYVSGDDVYIEVTDNGYGIPEEDVETLLTECGRKHARGSGVGLINVHSRIQLRFGREYGLKIESEPDEGTKVTIHLPRIAYSEENRMRLEEVRIRK